MFITGVVDGIGWVVVSDTFATVIGSVVGFVPCDVQGVSMSESRNSVNTHIYNIDEHTRLLKISFEMSN